MFEVLESGTETRSTVVDVRRTHDASFEVVLKIQETCNINCKYCYMYNLGNDLHSQVPKAASLGVCEAVASFVAEEFTNHEPAYCRIIFHGGEPMLMPPHRFSERLEAMSAILDARLSSDQRKRISFSLQTNATLVTDKWIDLLSHWNISVGVSVDGPASVHDRRRQDFQERGTHAAVVRGLAKLDQAAREGRIKPVGVLCVVDPESDGATVYNHIVHELGIDRLDFLLPFMTWDTFSADVQDGVEAFLSSAFQAWRQDRCAPHVRIFRTAMGRLVKGGAPTPRAGELSLSHIVLVVESDGSISAEETLRQTTEGRMTQLSVMTDTIDTVLADSDFGGSIVAAVTRADECAGCALAEPCSSGYGVGRVGQRFSAANGFARPPVYCPTFTTLFVEAARVLTKGGAQMERLGFPVDTEEALPWGSTT